MDVDHYGGWTQIFGGKASGPETSQLVKKMQFLPMPPAFEVLVGGDLLGISWSSFALSGQVCSVVCVILCLAVFIEHQLVTDA